MRTIISRFCDFYLSHYRISAVVALVTLVFCSYWSSKLTIDSNQLNLLPQDLPQVIEAKKITEMVGGTGYIVLGLRMKERDEGDKYLAQARILKHQGNEAEAGKMLNKANELYEKERPKHLREAEELKKASDELYEDLMKLKEVKFIVHKFSLEFVKKKLLYYMKTDDLREAFRRIGIKREEMIEKASPFYIELEKKDYNLDLSDIRKKYSKLGKKEIIDDYYVSPDRKMMIMTVKPSFSMNEIDKSRLLIDVIKETVAKRELGKRGIEVGFTGTYVQYVDNYDSISKSLAPTLWISMIGIAAILWIFIRRIRIILSLLISLVFSIIVTFGVTYIVIGKLNIITAIFGGILAGFGIDFGIQFIFRFREEFWHRQDMLAAIKESIIETGSAAFSSTLTIAVAFGVMIASEFRGFSEFGLISAYGIIITAFSMFFLTPLILVIFTKFMPGMMAYLSQKPSEKSDEQGEGGYKRWDMPKVARRILIFAPVIVVIMGYFSSRVGFDNDSRNMLAADLASEILKEEIDLRYDIAGDPMAVATDTIEEAASLFDYLDPLEGKNAEYIGQLVSLFSFIPPPDQQTANEVLIREFAAANSQIKLALIPPEYRQYWPMYLNIVGQKPFDFQDLPKYVSSPFRSVETSKVQGWLTFIYPQVDKLFLAQDIQVLDEIVGELNYPAVGRRTILKMALNTAAWERKTGRRAAGADVRKPVLRLNLSQRETNAVVDMANRMTAPELHALKILPGIADVIIKNRPYKAVEDIQKAKWRARTTGSVILVAKFTKIVLKESQTLIVGTIILVVGVLFASFRGIVSSLTALVPLVIGMISMLGAMALTNVKLNYFNIIIVPIIIGYGMNAGIFIMFRFFEDRSVSKVLYHTGAAIAASNLTSLAGWGSLIIAVHPGIRSMGYAACIGIATTMIASLVILPAILEVIEERKPGWLKRGRWPFSKTEVAYASASTSVSSASPAVDVHGEVHVPKTTVRSKRKAPAKKSGHRGGGSGKR